MDDHCERCWLEKVADVEFRGIRADLSDMKVRVEKLETTLGRGVMLLVANLAGMVAVLTRQLL